MRVTLAFEEVFFAAICGVMRRVSAMKRTRPEPYGTPDSANLWAVDIDSCGAEMAIAKALNRYWTPVRRKPSEIDSDVGGGFEVRSTGRANGCLILHDRDPDELRFILITGALPTFEICGWCYAHEGKDSAYWRSDLSRPAYFVPQSALKDPASLV